MTRATCKSQSLGEIIPSLYFQVSHAIFAEGHSTPDDPIAGAPECQKFEHGPEPDRTATSGPTRLQRSRAVRGCRAKSHRHNQENSRSLASLHAKVASNPSIEHRPLILRGITQNTLRINGGISSSGKS